MDDLRNFFKDKRVLITGHTGFKGGWLSQVLLGWGAKLSGIGLEPDTRPNLFAALGLKKKIDHYFADIRDFKKVREIFCKTDPEIVFHLAAQPLVRRSYDDSLYTFETNIIGTANILQVIKEVGGTRAAVMITTDKVYCNKEDGRAYCENDTLMGHDPYSASKACAEIIVDSYIKSFFNPSSYGKQHKTLIASVRPGNVIGGGDWQENRLVPDIIRSVFEDGQKIIIRNPNSIRPWQHVLEPTSGYLLLARKLHEGEKRFSGAWNFGPNENSYLTVKELLEKALCMLDNNSSYVIESDSKKHEAELLKLNSSKARNILNWRPKFDLDEVMESTFSWYRDFYGGKDIAKTTDEQIQSFFKKI